MKSLILFVLISSSAVCLSCRKKVSPSSEITTESRILADFNTINVSDAIEVQVHHSPNEYVDVEANRNLHDYIETHVVGGELYLRIKDNVRIRGNATILLHVYSDDIVEVEGYDASSIRFMDNWVAENTKVTLKGASLLQGEITSQEAYFEIEQASSIKIWGSCGNVTMDLKGASNMKDYSFECMNLIISLAGASSSKLTVNGSLSVIARGASTLNYQGDAVINEVNSSGASSINHH